MAVSRQLVGSSLQFSTRGLPVGKRLSALRELFDASIRMDIDAAPGHTVEMEMHLAPGLRRAHMQCPLTAQVARPVQRLADGEDAICLMIKTAGQMTLTQGHREGIPQTGDAVLLVYRQPAVIQFVDASYLSVRVPFSAVAVLADVEAAAGLCIPRHTQALSLLRSYVASLPDYFDSPQLCKLAATHVYDLLAVAMGATTDGLELASRGGVRAARLKVLQADLERDASQPIDQLASRHGISPRYVQLLFEEQGTTFSTFVLDCRLDAAWRMLRSPRYAARPILWIALEAGFQDLSHFNRRFKRRYLMTPSDARAQASIIRSDSPDTGVQLVT